MHIKLFWKSFAGRQMNSNGPHANCRPLVSHDCSKCSLSFNQFISTFRSHRALKHRHGLVQMNLRWTNRTMESLSLKLNTCDFSAGNISQQKVLGSTNWKYFGMCTPCRLVNRSRRSEYPTRKWRENISTNPTQLMILKRLYSKRQFESPLKRRQLNNGVWQFDFHTSHGGGYSWILASSWGTVYLHQYCHLCVSNDWL